MAKKLYKFHWDCGRSGRLDGLFIAEERDVSVCIDTKVSFGEALGKHSDVTGVLKAEHLEIIDIPEQTVEILEAKAGKTLSGYNPLSYIFEDYDYEEE